MTVAVKPPASEYVENGVTLTFAAQFRYLAPTDLLVQRIAEGGAITTLAYGVDYSATPGPTDAGGQVTLASVSSGTRLRIRRRTSRAQQTSYATSDRFPAKTHEAALDRAMLVDQEQDTQIVDLLARSLLVPDGETAPPLPGHIARSNRYLAFDQDGDPILYDIPTATGAIGAPVRTFGLIGLTVFPSDVAVVLTAGYGAVGAGAGRYAADMLASPAMAAAHPRFCRQSADGRFWRLLPDPGGIAVEQGGAQGGGVDDAAAIAAAAAYALAIGCGIRIQQRNRIGSAMTIAVPVSFDGGGRLAPIDVTVTLSGDVVAGWSQIFDLVGLGAIAGLKHARQAWFDGDLATPPGLPVASTVCDAALQKAIDALIPGGVLYGDARVRAKGAVAIDLKAASYDGGNIQFLWASAITMGFVASAGPPGFLKSFRFAPGTPGTIGTAGTAVLSQRTDLDVTDFEIVDPYNGVDLSSGVSQNVQRFRIYGAVRYGLRCKTSDLYYSAGIVQALNDWIVLGGVSGTFALYDSISVAGSIGYISAKYDDTHYRIFFNDVEPAPGMAITSSSGGSATIAAVTIGHQLGGVRTEGNVEAVCFTDMDVLGGLHSLQVVSYSGVAGRAGNMAFSRITDTVFFDTSYRGAFVMGAYGNMFDCWFANSRAISAAGAHFSFSRRNRGAGQFVSNSGYGLFIDGDCAMEDWSGSLFDGNCRHFAPEAEMAEMRVGGAAQRISMRHGSAGFVGSSGVTPPKGLWVDAAASDYLYFDGLQIPAGAVSWNSTGTHNRQP